MLSRLLSWVALSICPDKGDIMGCVVQGGKVVAESEFVTHCWLLLGAVCPCLKSVGAAGTDGCIQDLLHCSLGALLCLIAARTDAATSYFTSLTAELAVALSTGFCSTRACTRHGSA